MRLNFFFDVDGTLLPFGKGLPDDTLSALLGAKERGHRLFVATGRSPAEMDPRLSPIPFDGGIYCAGGTVVLEGEEKWSRRYTEEEKELFLSYIRGKDLLPIAQTMEGTYLEKETAAYFFSKFFQMTGKDLFVPNIRIVDSLDSSLEITKYLLLSPSGEMDRVRSELGEHFFVVDNTIALPQENMAEICLKGLDKGSGIRKLLSILGEDMATSVAVGDGANDKEMVAAAGLGIAMGNATEELKALAGFVTGDVECGGIRMAVEYAEKTYMPLILDR